MGLLCPAPRPIARPLDPGLEVEEQTLTFQKPRLVPTSLPVQAPTGVPRIPGTPHSLNNKSQDPQSRRHVQVLGWVWRFCS